MPKLYNLCFGTNRVLKKSSTVVQTILHHLRFGGDNNFQKYVK